MNTVTVRFIRVAETLSSLAKTGNNGRYMLPERGPKNAIQVTMANIMFFRAGGKAVYGRVGGFSTLSLASGELERLRLLGLASSNMTFRKFCEY